MSVNAYGGRTSVSVGLGLSAERLQTPVDAYVFVDGCPELPDGKPWHILLDGEGARKLGEDCAREGRSDAVCHASVPAAPGRYRLYVRAVQNGPVLPIDLSVERQRTWRSGAWDALMSV